MKKTFSIVCMVLMLAVGLIAFSSCNKGGENVLSGTRWTTTQENYTAFFEFTSTTFVYEKNDVSTHQVFRLKGDYTFDGKNISFMFTEFSGEGTPEYVNVSYANAQMMRKATINGTKLEYDGAVYDKQ